MAEKKPQSGIKVAINRAYRYGEAHVATVALVALGLGVVLTAIAAYSFFNEKSIEHRVTKVESPCNIHPAGKECQGIKKRSDEKRSVASACVLAYKLDKDGQLLRLTKCPVEPGRQRKVEDAEDRSSRRGPVAAADEPNGGDATSAPTGSSQPGRHDGGSSESGSTGDGEAGRPSHPHQPKVPSEPSHGGEAVPPTAPSKESSESSSSTSTTTTERTKETVVEAPAEAEPPVRTSSGLEAVTESVGKTVEGLGETVGGTVEGVEATTCQLAKLLCHE